MSTFENLSFSPEAYAECVTTLLGLRGGLLGSTRSSQIDPALNADSSPVCEAFREVEQERLHRRGGIAEAVERKNTCFVPVKTDDQLDLQAIHRVRHLLIARRTALINLLRAFLLDFHLQSRGGP
jgi:hypothetical protein